MKSTTATVQYTHPLTVAVSDLARVSPRHGVAAYASSLGLAAITLAGTSFFREIRRTFTQQHLGVSALTLWEAAFCVVAVAWLAAVALGVACMMQKGRTRSFGAYSLAINIATVLLAVCTMLW